MTVKRKLGSNNRVRYSQHQRNDKLIQGFLSVLTLVALTLTAMTVHLTALVDSSKHSTTVVGVGAPVASGVARILPRGNEGVHSRKLHSIDDKNASSANQMGVRIVSQDESSSRPYPSGPKTDAKYTHDRVYCMVPFIWNKEIYDVIMSTWGKRCNVINFITDAMVLDGGNIQGDVITEEDDDPTKGYKHHTEFQEGTFPDNVHFIEMTRPWTGCKDPKTEKPRICRHIWEKMWRSWVYVGDNHLNQADWFCKVDFDTFFFPENLQYFVRDQKDWDPYNEHHYFGNVLSHEKNRPAMAAGAAACWSHRTMAGITEVYKHMPKGYDGKRDRGRCEDRPQASEEISTSLCLYKELNVTVEPMRDEEMREYVTTSPIKDALTWNRTEQGEWWYWQGKPENVGQMDDCCSRRPMGLHKYKQKKQIEQLEQHFYGPSDNNEIKRLDERTRTYVNKVRNVMGIAV